MLENFLAMPEKTAGNHLEEQLPTLIAKLQAIGEALLPLIPETTEAIEVGYRGCGDQGEIEKISILPLREMNDGSEMVWEMPWGGPNGVQQGEKYQPTTLCNHCELPEAIHVTFDDKDHAVKYSSEELAEEIKNLAFEILYNQHPGWETLGGEGEGSEGTLRLQLPSLVVSLTHSTRYIACDTYNNTWSLNA